MAGEPRTANSELVSVPQVQASKPPAHGARQILGRLLGREDPKLAAQRKEQEATFKAYFADQYKTVIDSFFNTGRIDMTNSAAEQRAGLYQVQAVKDGLHITRNVGGGTTEVMELTPQEEVVFSRAIIKDHGTMLDPGVTYEHTGKFHIDYGVLEPIRDVKTISTGTVNLPEFKAGLHSKALEAFVADVRASNAKLPRYGSAK